MKSSENYSIIYFDGICHLCNSFVDFVAQKDTEKQFRFAPLQGETARKNLKPEDLVRLETVVVQTKQGSILRESEAAIYCLEEIGQFRWLIALSKKMPLNFKNLVYRLVAKNRYRLFGKNETCRLPSPEDLESLLP